MTNDIIFYTQIISIVVFVLTVFGLYKILIDQKNATIEFLKEKIFVLESKLEDQSPDLLLDRITKRASLLSEELANLSNESEENKSLISEKETELKEINDQMLHYKFQLAKAIGLMTEHFCPKCADAPIVIRNFYPVFGYVNGKEIEADSEYVEYECGYILRDGKEEGRCSNTG